ncbi:MAG: nitroreductase family protein [Desulfobacterota bacterium]|nr:nitroreductase family protein [Thermodesulfobacteriota bacterium]MDW8001611.1 nitroreductase family protein [Deltaproteobacteria bacterium]
MEILDLIKRRRSIRIYEDRPIPEEHLIKLLEAARWAPTGANIQPWHFIVVRDEKTRKEIGEYAKFFFFKSSHVAKAPCIIVLCYEKDKSKFGIYDATLAGGNILLVAESLGLGTCWIGAFDEEKVKEILGIPENVKVIALITVGYPKERPDAPKRLEIEKIVHYENWSNVKKKSLSDSLFKSGPLSIIGKFLKYVSI